MKLKIIRIDLDGVNCYLLKENECFILVDTGGHTIMDKQFSNRQDRLEFELEKAGCNSDNLKLIILTHGDSDHVANASFIRDKFRTPIAMHLSDLELVKSPSIEKVMESFCFKSLKYKLVFGIMKRSIKKITIKILDDYKSFTPDIFLNEGDQMKEYGVDAKILHIPGHTYGSIGVLTANNDLIVGDTLANTNKPGSAPNAIDFQKLEASIKRLRGMGVKTVYPGHGLPFEMEELRC